MAPGEAAQVVLILRAVRLSGNTAFSDQDLEPFYRGLIGKRTSLKQIFDVAAAITAHYGGAGYALSRVIVPPQEISPSGAVVTLRVIEGYVDRVVWPSTLERYRDFFSDYAVKITSERPVRVQTMERYLLLANDLPGLSFRSRLEASKTNPLASTMIIEVDEQPFGLRVGIDNRGTEGSGPVQPQVIGTANNLLGFHEQVTAGYITAGPDQARIQPELHYVLFGYHQVLTSEGLAFDFSGNVSRGDPGTKLLNALDFASRGENFSFALSYPLIRTRSENLTATVAFDLKHAKGRQLGTVSSNDRLRIVRGELAYERADELRGVNQVVLSVSQGIDALGGTKNGNPVASRANGKVDFFKGDLQVSRTQGLPENFSLYVAGFGQWTDDPLLSSQECGYGGAYYGRGFDPSVITGDTCLKLLSELRHDVGLELSGISDGLDVFQVYGFADYGRIWNLEAPLGTPKNDDAASAGLGLRLGKREAWSVDLQAARTVERPDSIAVDGPWRFFFNVTATY